ncbi:MAG: S-layer homology domain-containing protein [Oscillospiraceae bacterium]|nr:S-layer homology domain-containing protein [Oscillospiraceae bacterium]
MKKLNKILSVGLSLAMCVSMVAPAFAANFDDLQNAVNGEYGTPGVKIGDTGRYGYGNSLNEENTQYEIEAWDDGGTRRVELNADVEFDKDVDGNRDNGGIWFWRTDKEVAIELNGHDIDLNPGAELDAETGKFYDKAGNEVDDADLNQGTVLIVTGGSLTITDSEGTGKITGGNAWSNSKPGESYKDSTGTTGVGAVYVENNGSFTMEGGSVSGNRSQGPAICAENTDRAKDSSNLDVTLKGVTVENNYTEAGGTIYFRDHAGTVNATIEDCVITGNVAEGDAIDFGIYGKGQGLNATVTNTTITGNRVDKDDGRTYDHGGVALWQGDGKNLNVTFDGCTIQDNEGGCTGIYYDKRGEDGLTITDGNNTICGNGQVGNEGTSVTYQDGTTLDAMHTDKYWETLGGTEEEGTCVAAGSISYVCPFCKCPHTVETAMDPDNHDMGEWHTTKEPGPGVAGEEQRECMRGCGLVEVRPIDPLPIDPLPVYNPTPVTGDETEIEDVEVPLAGIFTRADAIGYLWEQTGKPEAELSTFADVPEDHQWAVAIGWAQDMGIAVADEDGNFRPDDLVLRSTEDIEGEFQEFLNRYAVFAGIELDEGELFIKLAGAADDVIMGEEAQVIFNDFFAKLAAALAQAA